MVSGIFVAIISLATIGIIVSYITFTLPEETSKTERPAFVDFSLRQEGSNLLIQNGGISNISAGSLKVYFEGTLTQATNKDNIQPGHTYNVKISELPSFEGRKNITVVAGNINRSLEVISIKQVTLPASEVFPSLPTQTPQPVPSAKIYTLSIGIVGAGTVTTVPNASDFEEGTEVEINATPHVNYTFGYWIFNGDQIQNVSLLVKMDRNHSAKAVFLIRSDVDCIRTNPRVLVTNKTEQSNISMTYLVNVTNRDYKCEIESFELSNSCPSGFNCELKNRLVSIQSGNSSATVDFLMSPKNVTAAGKGNYTFFVTAKNNAKTTYSTTNSSFYEIK